MISDRLRRSLAGELRRSFLAKLGIVLVAVVIFAAAFAPILAPHDPTDTNPSEANLPPLGFSTTENQTTSQVTDDGDVEIVEQRVQINATTSHPLGTDPVGRDVLSRVLFGARTSLLVGLFGTVLAVGFGVTVGLIAGYYGGRLDDGLMRLADIMLAFPSLVLAIALIGLWGQQSVPIPDPFARLGLTPGMPDSAVLPGTVVVVVALVNWVWFARVARGEALSIRNEEYVKAARSLGMPDVTLTVERYSVPVPGVDLTVERYSGVPVPVDADLTVRRHFGVPVPVPKGIIVEHVLPNSVTPILVLATIQVAAIILLESALSFLGFSGANLSWGIDIAQGRDYLSSAWWIATVPGIAIVITVVGVNLIGDWLRDALDPGVGQGEGGV